MSSLRIFLRSQRVLAMMIVAVALCVRALVPAGFMLGADNPTHTITIQICSGNTVQTVTLALSSSHKDGKHGDKTADAPCAYSALSMGAIQATDPLQLALALAFILLLGYLPQRAMALRARAHVLPPPCGPPAIA